MDAEIYKKEQQQQRELLKSILLLTPALCHCRGSATEAVPVTKPNIGPASWVYECPRLGANIIQQSEPAGHVAWREYEPNGRDRAPIVLHYFAVMNNEKTNTLVEGGNQIWEFQVAIYDPEKFWFSVQENGELKSGFKHYFNLLATLWSETFKIPIRDKECQMDSLVTKIETVNYPKADQ